MLSLMVVVLKNKYIFKSEKFNLNIFLSIFLYACVCVVQTAITSQPILVKDKEQQRTICLWI